MAWHEAITTGLPPARGGEPADLRRDIADELSDHLACATARELRRSGGDAAAARRAVLDRFGSPERVARRLWLDAMKETIMRHRIALVTNVVLALACIAICVVAFSALRQNTHENRALLEQLHALRQLEADRASMDWTEASVTVRRTAGDDRPVEGFHLELTGRPFDGAAQSASTIRLETDEDGRAVFGPIRPGSYLLRATDSSQRTHRQTIVLYPGSVSEFEVGWPHFDRELSEVTVTTELPEDLASVVAYQMLRFQPLAHDDGTPDDAWTLPPVLVLARPDGRAVVLDEPDVIEEYDHEGEGRARINVDAVVFTDAIALDSDLRYRLESIGMYLDLEPGEDLHVHRVHGPRAGRSHRPRDFDLPPFAAAAGSTPTWTVKLPLQVAAEVRALVPRSPRTGSGEGGAFGAPRDNG